MPLVRNTVVNLLFRSCFLTMQKKVNFKISSPDSEDSSSMEDFSEIVMKIKNFIPELTEFNHKGSCGRIGIIGGSPEYTGAPYFAGMAAIKLGADLVHIFCCKEAAIPIKSYSPELMVHPILDGPDLIKNFEPWLQRLHALVIGPGLGRNPAVLNNVAEIIMYCKTKKTSVLPLVLDADALFLVSEKPELIKNYKGPLILTPNLNEYEKLVTKMDLSNFDELAANLNAIIVKKGAFDAIQNGILITKFKVSPQESLLVCDIPGSNRRCGGQGDILAGFIATFVGWVEIYLKKNKSSFNFDIDVRDQYDINFWKNYSYAAYGGCLMTRTCNNLGFKELGRSLTTSDMIRLIGRVFVICFEK